MTKHTPVTPEEFAVMFPQYVYRSGKGAATIQWRQAAMDFAHAANAYPKLVEALKGFGKQIRAKAMIDARTLLRELGETE